MKKYLLIMAISFLLTMSGFGSEIQLNIATIELKPMGYLEAPDQKKGILFEISNAIAKDAGLTASNTILPYGRSILQVEKGLSDFVLIFANDMLEEHAVNLGNALDLTNVIITKASSPVSKLTELHGKTIAHVTNANYDETYQSDQMIKKFYTQSYDHNFNLLFKDRVHGVVGPRIGLYFTAKKMGFGKKDFSPPLILNKKGVAAYISKKFNDRHRSKARKLRKIIEHYYSSGKSSQIIEKYNPFAN